MQGQFTADTLRRLWQHGQHLQTCSAVRNGIVMAMPPHSILRCLPAILHGPEAIPAVLEVHRQLGGNFPPLFPIRRFQPLPDQLMHADATPDQYPRIHHFLIQGMTEAILAGHRTVRPGSGPVGLHEALSG
jgi:hypothetical protein